LTQSVKGLRFKLELACVFTLLLNGHVFLCVPTKLVALPQVHPGIRDHPDGRFIFVAFFFRDGLICLPGVGPTASEPIQVEPERLV
jgi:hypothetical protein